MKRILAILVLGILLFGCTQSGAQTGGDNGSTGGTAKVTIHIKGFAFNPPVVTVKQGETVMWVNDDSAPHTVAFSGFTSATLQNGGTFSHTFNEAPGDYAYVCSIHPTMKGTVTVTK